MIDLSPLRSLASSWEKDAATYLKQANVLQSSLPSDLTPEQTGMGYQAGSLRVCAKSLRDAVEILQKQIDALDSSARMDGI